ncbi:MAG: N-acetylmuramoyl-L-alanine amidase [Candidatus Omnitrophica bacterium]|nr:N-acetylmuramoyl-L-alanine amidase [Candidatus Omnitrophota bacterium]
MAAKPIVPPAQVFACALIAALAVGGCATAPPAVTLPPRSSPTVAPGVSTHRVLPGETAWSLSRRYGVSVSHLLRANRLADPRQLPAGTVLVIPRPTAAPVRAPLYPNPQWTHIVIHHSATRVDNAARINRAHRQRGFTNGLGYHFVIDNGSAGRRDGQLEIGHRWRRQMDGAHCNAGGMNHHGIGICLIGNFTNRQPSEAQLATLAGLVNTLRAYYRIPLSRIVRHQDVPGKETACPGDRFPWAAFRARLTAPE